MIIETRYEYWSKEGKIWTKWFKKDKVESEKEGKEKIKALPKITNKLKNEYRIKKDL